MEVDIIDCISEFEAEGSGWSFHAFVRHWNLKLLHDVHLLLDGPIFSRSEQVSNGFHFRRMRLYQQWYKACLNVFISASSIRMRIASFYCMYMVLVTQPGLEQARSPVPARCSTMAWEALTGLARAVLAAFAEHNTVSRAKQPPGHSWLLDYVRALRRSVHAGLLVPSCSDGCAGSIASMAALLESVEPGLSVPAAVTCAERPSAIAVDDFRLAQAQAQSQSQPQSLSHGGGKSSSGRNTAAGGPMLRGCPIDLTPAASQTWLNLQRRFDRAMPAVGALLGLNQLAVAAVPTASTGSSPPSLERYGSSSSGERYGSSSSGKTSATADQIAAAEDSLGSIGRAPAGTERTQASSGHHRSSDADSGEDESWHESEEDDLSDSSIGTDEGDEEEDAESSSTLRAAGDGSVPTRTQARGRRARARARVASLALALLTGVPRGRQSVRDAVSSSLRERLGHDEVHGTFLQAAVQRALRRHQARRKCSLGAVLGNIPRQSHEQRHNTQSAGQQANAQSRRTFVPEQFLAVHTDTPLDAFDRSTRFDTERSMGTAGPAVAMDGSRYDPAGDGELTDRLRHAARRALVRRNQEKKRGHSGDMLGRAVLEPLGGAYARLETGGAGMRMARVGEQPSDLVRGLALARRRDEDEDGDASPSSDWSSSSSDEGTDSARGNAQASEALKRSPAQRDGATAVEMNGGGRSESMSSSEDEAILADGGRRRWEDLPLVSSSGQLQRPSAGADDRGVAEGQPPPIHRGSRASGGTHAASPALSGSPAAVSMANESGNQDEHGLQLDEHELSDARGDLEDEAERWSSTVRIVYGPPNIGAAAHRSQESQGSTSSTTMDIALRMWREQARLAEIAAMHS